MDSLNNIIACHVPAVELYVRGDDYELFPLITSLFNEIKNYEAR